MWPTAGRLQRALFKKKEVSMPLFAENRYETMQYKARGQTLSQMALAWNLHHQAVTSVLIGASRVEQVVENVAALRNLTFREQELQAIDAITLEQ
jgi:aryl-alcohol dehydrogenase-like predicted oxidoreductase